MPEKKRTGEDKKNDKTGHLTIFMMMVVPRNINRQDNLDDMTKKNFIEKNIAFWGAL